MKFCILHWLILNYSYTAKKKGESYMEKSKSNQNFTPIVKTDIDPETRVPVMNVRNYQHLVQASQLIAKQAQQLAQKGNISKKDARSFRVKINKLRRALNKRKRFYGKGYKHLSKQVNNLRSILSEGTDSLNQRLDKFKAQDQKQIKEKLKPILHRMCQVHQIPDQPVPDEALKLSMSKKKRVHTLLLAVQQGLVDTKQYVYDQRLRIANVQHDQAVDGDTGNVLGVAQKYCLMGKPSAVHQLKADAKKLHIYLKKL